MYLYILRFIFALHTYYRQVYNYVHNTQYVFMYVLYTLICVELNHHNMLHPNTISGIERPRILRVDIQINSAAEDEFFRAELRCTV